MSTTRNFRTISLLLLIFIIPAILAWVFYSYHLGQHRPHSNHGTLITPPVAIDQWHLQTTKHQVFPTIPNPTARHPHAITEGRWLLLYFYPGPCEASCQSELELLARLHRALGKEAERVTIRRLRAANETPIQKAILPIGMPADLLVPEHFSQQLAQSPAKVCGTEPGTFWLSDPLGNVMMCYSPKANPNDILKDLEHLLAVSQIG